MENRIKLLKETLNKTSLQMAKDLQVSHYTVDSWINGNRKPRPSSIKLIESIYHLNPGWLIGSQEKMFFDSGTDQNIFS